MSEYAHVEQPLLTQLGGLGWTVMDQGSRIIPQDPARSRCAPASRDLILPQVFRDSVRALNQTGCRTG